MSYVSERNTQGLPGSLRLKANRSKEDRDRASELWQARQAAVQQLVTAGVPPAQIEPDGNSIWLTAPDGSLQLLAKMNGITPQWQEAAPEALRL